MRTRLSLRPGPWVSTLLAGVSGLGCGAPSICEEHLGALCSAPEARRALAVVIDDAALVDLEGDGVDEVALVDRSADSLLLVGADGRFESREGMGLPEHLVRADLDGDGRGDLVIASDAPAELRRLRSRGDGSFDELDALPLPTPARALASADLNGDGAPELLVGIGEAVRVIDGASGASKRHIAGGTVIALDLADLNGDGALDLVAVDLEGAAIRSFLGDGAGGLSPAAIIPIGPAPQAIDLADVSGDGRVDAIVRPRIYPGLWVAAGDGAGGFAPPIAIDVDASSEADGVVASAPRPSGLAGLVTPTTTGLLTSTFDGGAAPFGRSELKTPGAPRRIGGGLVAGAGFVAPLELQGGPQPILRGTLDAPGAAPQSSLAAADLDGDGRLDLALIDGACLLQIALGVDGEGAPTWLEGPPLAACPGALDAADLSGDGVPDLVLSGAPSGVQLAIGDGAGGFAPGPLFELASFDRPVIVDGPPRALVAIDHAQDGLIILGGDAEGALSPLPIPALTPLRIASGDLDGDGDGDLVVLGAGALLAPLLRDGDALIAGPLIDPWALLPWPPAQEEPGLALADLDDDGRAEAILPRGAAIGALADLDGPAATLWLDHSLSAGEVAAGARHRVADLDGDGHPELVSLDGDTLTLVAGAPGGFATLALTVGLGGAELVALTDIGGDGRRELLRATTDAVRIFEAADVTLPRLGPSIALPTHDETSVVFGAAPTFGDVDGDGRLDAIHMNHGTITIAWGDDGRFARVRGEATPPDLRAGLAAGDLDGAGRQDALVLAGLGAAGILRWGGDRWIDDGVRWPLEHIARVQPAALDLDGDGRDEAFIVWGPHPGDPTFGLVELDAGGSARERFASGVADLDALPGCAARAALHGGDLDGDGLVDLVVEDGCDNVALLWNDGAGGLQGRPLDVSAAIIAGVGELIAVQAGTIVRIAVHGRSLLPPASTHLPGGRLSRVGDCSGDGRPDLLSTTGAEYSRLHVGVGDSFVDLLELRAASARCVDVDGDRVADLVGLDATGVVTRLSGGGG